MTPRPYDPTPTPSHDPTPTPSQGRGKDPMRRGDIIELFNDMMSPLRVFRHALKSKVYSLKSIVYSLKPIVYSLQSKVYILESTSKNIWQAVRVVCSDTCSLLTP